MSVLSAADICLLFVGGAGKSSQTSHLRQTARLRHWLVVDVELVKAEDGPWMGAAMPGSPRGCGIFAGAETREFVAQCDAGAVYLSATLDHLLSANGVRSIFLAGEAPNCFVDGMRGFAVAHGYEFGVGSPGETSGSAVEALRPMVRDFASRLSPEN